MLPGVTSAFGGLASAGIPGDHARRQQRDHPGHGLRRGKRRRPRLGSARPHRPADRHLYGPEAYGRDGGRLLAGGLADDTPAALVENATLPEERTVVATLGTLVEAAARENIVSPALIVIGHIVSLREKFGR